jgi:hypothetical protein
VETAFGLALNLAEFLFAELVRLIPVDGFVGAGEEESKAVWKKGFDRLLPGRIVVVAINGHSSSVQLTPTRR